MNIATIRLDCVALGDRLRAVDEDYAQLIAESMRTDGQRTPIEVRAPGKDGRWQLIAGAHRWRAAQLAGLNTLLAVVLDVGDLDARRLEIEENLCRHELTDTARSLLSVPAMRLLALLTPEPVPIPAAQLGRPQMQELERLGLIETGGWGHTAFVRLSATGRAWRHQVNN